MEEIRVNKDISGYEENLLFGLTLRQTLWGGLALAAAAGVYVLMKRHFDDMIAGLAAAAAAAPFAGMAFFKWHGLNAFQAIRKIWRAVKAPRHLLYRSSTIYLLERGRQEKTKKKGLSPGKENKGKP